MWNTNNFFLYFHLLFIVFSLSWFTSAWSCVCSVISWNVCNSSLVRDITAWHSRHDNRQQRNFCCWNCYVCVWNDTDLLRCRPEAEAESSESCRSATVEYCIVCWCVAVARNNRIAFCDTVLDRNRRCRLPETDSSIDHDAAEKHSNLLDAYFPFEPYNLTQCVFFVASTCIFYPEMSKSWDLETKI